MKGRDFAQAQAVKVPKLWERNSCLAGINSESSVNFSAKLDIFLIVCPVSHLADRKASNTPAAPSSVLHREVFGSSLVQRAELYIIRRFLIVIYFGTNSHRKRAFIALNKTSGNSENNISLMFRTQGKSPAKSTLFNHRETVEKAAPVCAGSPPPQKKKLFYFPALHL